jgi:mono/diheme cytochrome c family protein
VGSGYPSLCLFTPHFLLFTSSEDGFPMENVENDEEGLKRQALDQLTRRSVNLLGPWAHPEGKCLWLCAEVFMPATTQSMAHLTHIPTAGFSIRDEGVYKPFMLRTLAFVLIVAFLIIEPGHTERAGAGDILDASPPSVGHMEQGKALYEGVARCVHCHGRTALRRALTAQELFSIIKFGVPGTSHMPFTYLLSDEEIWSIVYYQLRDTCQNGCAMDPS